MSNRAAKIAGPMLRKFDALGRAVTPASPDAVRLALHDARCPPEVITEWENEAYRRGGYKSTSATIGNAYRQSLRDARKRALELQDRRRATKAQIAAINSRRYRPGIVQRALDQLSALMRHRAKRKAERLARRRAA